MADDAGELIERLVALHLTGLCAEAAGILRAACDETFAYLVTRKQFGAPLASFQALQHRAADMHIAAEEARVLASRAADLLATQVPSAHLFAAAAKARVDDVARPPRRASGQVACRVARHDSTVASISASAATTSSR